MLFVLFFKKRVETCLRIYWIPIIAIETVSYHLLRPMARVGGHGGLKLNLKRGRLCLLRPQAFETWDVQFYTIWAEVSSSMAWLLAFAKSFPSFVSRVVGLFMPLCNAESHARENLCSQGTSFNTVLQKLPYMVTFSLIINNCWTRLSKISWFVSGEHNK